MAHTSRGSGQPAQRESPRWGHPPNGLCSPIAYLAYQVGKHWLSVYIGRNEICSGSVLFWFRVYFEVAADLESGTTRSRWFMLQGRFLRSRRSAERGQGLVEYSLIIALVAIVVIAILVLMGPQIGQIFSTITNGL